MPSPHVIDLRRATIRGQHLFASNDPLAVEFLIDGERVSLELLLDANEDDPAFCAWAREAVPGDSFPGCECVLQGVPTAAEIAASFDADHCHACRGQCRHAPDY